MTGTPDWDTAQFGGGNKPSLQGTPASVGPASEDSSGTHLRSLQHSSASSEDLLCDDELSCDEDLSEWRPYSAAQTETHPLAEPSDNVDAGELARHEAEHMDLPRPYFHLHAGLNEGHRALTAAWLAEVALACELTTATLFLAISYLDRFLAAAKDVHAGMLQLVATAAISIAAKNEEVVRPTTSEWVFIADNSFTASDLVQMEFMMLHCLGWRVRVPTAYTFLHLYCSAMGATAASDAKAATYMIELAQLDVCALHFTSATVAAAGLLAAHRMRGAAFDLGRLLQLAPCLAEGDVKACAAVLGRLHRSCSDPAYSHLQAARRRYLRRGGV